jgi:hypothetical protein
MLKFNRPLVIGYNDKTVPGIPEILPNRKAQKNSLVGVGFFIDTEKIINQICDDYDVDNFRVYFRPKISCSEVIELVPIGECDTSLQDAYEYACIAENGEDLGMVTLCVDHLTKFVPNYKERFHIYIKI